MKEDAPLPFVEPNADTGSFVKALLEVPPGTNLVGAGSLSPWGEWCKIWGRMNEVECTLERQDRRVIEETAGVVGWETADMYRFFEDYGYGGVDEKNVVYPWDLPVKVRYTTMEEYMRSQDWSSVLRPDGESAATP
ncbi:hypothetical protein E8E11_002686 [Didymella keratinophila]|nr:hypothetical protein E8E11_002686 [Didymella keratinophila]